MERKEINIKEMVQFRRKLDKFCVAPTNTWKLRILLESMNDYKFYKYVNKVLNKLKNIKSEELYINTKHVFFGETVKQRRILYE